MVCWKAKLLFNTGAASLVIYDPHITLVVVVSFIYRKGCVLYYYFIINLLLHITLLGANNLILLLKIYKPSRMLIKNVPKSKIRTRKSQVKYQTNMLKSVNEYQIYFSNQCKQIPNYTPRRLVLFKDHRSRHSCMYKLPF